MFAIPRHHPGDKPLVGELRRPVKPTPGKGWVRGTWHPALPPAPPRGRTHGAFTLVELMVVIVIIGILMAIILPVLGSIRTKAKEAAVIGEIKQLDMAINTFKTKYGVEPPSRMVIFLNLDGWNSAFGQQYKSLVKRVWPQFDFAMGETTSGGTTGAGAGTVYPASWKPIADTNNTNLGIYGVTLNSGECLMFFLGGIIANGAPTGFSSNAAYPFSPTGSARVPPFLEFAIGRIVDTDGNGMPEYMDSLPGQSRPYLYFSSYEGKGYRTFGPTLELPNNGTTFLYLHDVYRNFNGTGTPLYPPTAPITAAGATPVGSQTYPAHKHQTFQIISPGFDGEYGEGGVFNPNFPDAGLTNSNGLPDQPAFDNLTNFHGTRLNP